MESILDRVTVAFRCPMNWDEMAGGGSERFCSRCQKSVVDLSEMTTEEAEGFIRENGPRGSACVRLLRDSQGKLVTQGCGSTQENAKASLRKVAVGAAVAGSLSLAACANKEPVAVTGMICLPAEK